MIEIALLDEQHGGEVVLLHLDVLGHGKAYRDLPISDVRVSAADGMQRVRAPGPFWPDFDESEATLSEMRPPTRVRTARLLLDDRDERAELPVAEEEAQPGDDADQDRDEELAVVGVDVGRDRAA